MIARLLIAFAFFMTGINPISIAGVGKIMSAASMGVMLPGAGTCAIIMPWIIGQIADYIGLNAGGMMNLLPCAGIMILSSILMKSGVCPVSIWE